MTRQKIILMNLKLANKVVMVTGSAKGIGRGIAEEFLNQGANTILVDKDKRALNNTYDTFVKKFGLSQVSSYTADSLNKSDLKLI